MARTIGDFLLQKELSVHWVTSSPEQQAELRQRIEKARRRTAKFFPERLGQFDADCHLLASGDIPLPDVIIESTHESLLKKRQVFASLSHLITEQTLLFSNSSSLLPQTLHPHCLGAHFFYPVQLTGCIEMIIPDACSDQRRDESLQFFDENSLDVFEQNENNAFLINRLLLPLQSACLRALQDGFSAAIVEEASKSELIGLGQLSMMDTIGLDLIHVASMNYRNLFETVTQAEHDLPISGLAKLLQIGKMGKKNSNGLLSGSDLPWSGRESSEEERRNLQEHLRVTLKKTCLRELCLNNISLDQLQMICERIFQAKGFSKTFFTEKMMKAAEATGNSKRPLSTVTL
jgi:3-hydroxyacyl-CoA dehydrogenase